MTSVRISDYRTSLGGAASMAEKATATADEALSAATLNRVDLGAGAITFKDFVSIQLGLKDVTIAVAGALEGDRLTLRPIEGWPAGFANTEYIFVPSAGTVALRLLVPVVTLATTIKLPFRITAIRQA